MTRPRRWKWLLSVIAVPLLVWGCDRSQMICWVGSTDLEVEFRVTGAGSGAPVPGAQVEVQSEGGIYEEDTKQAFVLDADTHGVARKDCRGSMCYGTRSELRFTDTFVVHLPWWRFRLTAPDYEPSEWVYLDVPESVSRVERVGAGRARLVVPVSLRVSQNAAGAAPAGR